LPLPIVLKSESRLDLDEGVIVPLARGYSDEYDGDDGVEVSLSGETYLRLSDVDLDDPDAIFAFTSQYGPLGGEDAYLSLVSEDEDSFFKNLYGSALNWPLENEKKQRALWNDPQFAECARVEPLDKPGKAPSFPSEISNVLSRAETLDEFRFAARCVRDLTSAWQMIRNNLDITDIEWLSWTPDLWEDKNEPLYLLTAILARFLRFFSPQLAYETGFAMIHDQTEDTGKGRAQPKRGPSKVPLYAICALELFNHIIEDAEYRICANERCKRTFVHQEGRSQKGQRRSRGVIYCSPACARAKAQREYRKRTRGNAGD
jgi:hypothetical protein